MPLSSASLPLPRCLLLLLLGDADDADDDDADDSKGMVVPLASVGLPPPPPPPFPRLPLLACGGALGTAAVLRKLPPRCSVENGSAGDASLCDAKKK